MTVRRTLTSVGAILGSILASPVFAAPRPKLVVAIVVDQFSADLFDEYRGRFHDGLKRLATHGVVFSSGYHGHAATETCPGASTIMTGAYPARTGIIGNSWFDLKAGRQVYCAEDPDAASSVLVYGRSAKYLRSNTLSDRLKFVNSSSRVVAVGGKDRLAIMLGGHAIDQLWFWDDEQFKTNRPVDAPLPKAVVRANALARAAIEQIVPGTISSECRDHIDAKPLFPAPTARLPSASRRGAISFRTSGGLDLLTAQLALDLTDTMALGRGSATDVLAIGLAATDYIGHATGSGSAEMCEQMRLLDRLIGTVASRLESMGQPFVLVLTADHGSKDAPERSRARGDLSAERFNPQLLVDAVNHAIRARFGIEGNARFYADGFGDIYLDPSAKESRPQIATIAKNALLEFPQVDAVFTVDQLLRTDLPTTPVTEWTLRQRARAGFDPGRSGDLIVLLKPNITAGAFPDSGYVAGEGSTARADQRVPIIFWWPDIKPAATSRPVQVVDIMPTLAAIVGLDVPAGEVDGHCLVLQQEDSWPCPPSPTAIAPPQKDHISNAAPH